MTVHIKDVTNENSAEILKLQIHEKQRSFIETTEQCLEDAIACKYYRPVGLYMRDTLVGFAMYGFFPGEGENGRVWLDRFFIDAKHQGQGLGTLLLEALIERLIREYACPEVYLSIVEENQAASHLYKKFGFAFNGEADFNNEKVMVKKI
ncbi:GNAT family N-acetyltransferase [Peribacillus muralis]|uniref:GNAT family N-acetyltransferase n=1 Tax=Peribacillus muralis TaxID=264697 RepID=UPI001F4DC820|nr:GNAT family N-acetyltransferase [Peribacillus muralis]MCK1994756.1 GNAT family N-acetyltransferase [Peribacillus muralis]MCK2015417.1 GNAT family N-acetyltransferase [Peribacillus muralis]